MAHFQGGEVDPCRIAGQGSIWPLCLPSPRMLPPSNDRAQGCHHHRYELDLSHDEAQYIVASHVSLHGSELADEATALVERIFCC